MQSPKCACSRPAAWQQRIAIPKVGSGQVERWLYTGQMFCLDCRKAPPKAETLVDDAARAAIAESMKPDVPDWRRAYLEWMK